MKRHFSRLVPPTKGRPRAGGKGRSRRLGPPERLEDRCLLAADLFGAQTLSHAGSWQAVDAPVPAQYRLITPGSVLSSRSDGDPLDTALRFLTQNAPQIGLTDTDLQHFIVTDQYRTAHNGVTHIYLRQTLNGLEIANADINVNVTAGGEVINVGSSFVPGVASNPARFAVAPALTAREAVLAVARAHDWPNQTAPAIIEQQGGAKRTTVLDGLGIAKRNFTAQLHYVPTSDGDLTLAWKLNFETADGRHWYDVSVAANTGEVLDLVDWASAATYRVYARPKMSPVSGARTLETDPYLLATNASPYGWHDNDGVAGADFTTTRGNNVFAYADTDDDELPDAGSVPDGGASQLFDFPISLAQQPINYQAAAVTNLFYWTNLLHDIHYQYGFDEVAGNFQDNNYGKGGVGGDYLLAEAQDGEEFNNANFITPPEGQNGRMQVFLWNTTNPLIDGDLDSGVIIHEYGHGVSTRLTGGPGNSNTLTTVQSAGLGEGWSDWYALMLTQRASDRATDARGIGTYMLGQPSTSRGIRTTPYSYSMSIDPLTYGDVAQRTDPHDIGEIWASALWDLNWLLIEGDRLDSILPPPQGFDADMYGGGGGNNVALQLIMDGMKLQPANPSFLDARDAILAADQINNGGANQFAIWRAFARRGMGYSASDGGNSNSRNIQEAFDLPAEFAGQIELSQDEYKVGDPVHVVLRDLHLEQGPVLVSISSSSGDVEIITLNRTGLGTFEGTVPTADLPASVQNGVLEAENGDTITVTYNDANDGTGQPATVQDSSEMFVIHIEGGELHYFTYRAGDSVTLSTETPTGDLDVMISVYSPRGVLLYSDDNSATDGRNARLQFVVSEAGQYIVQVQEVAGQGPYELRSRVVPAGVVVQFSSSTGSFNMLPGQRDRVTVTVTESPLPLMGFQLSFVNSNVSAGQLELENWEPGPTWGAIDATLDTPLDTFVGGISSLRSTPLVLGSFDLVAPTRTGEYRLTVDAVADTPDDTGFLSLSGAVDVLDFGDVMVRVVDAAAPTGSLVTPADGSWAGTDLGYVDIRWVGSGGIDPSSIDAGDILIESQQQQVSIDEVLDLGSGVWRYIYDQDGDSLPEGIVSVSILAGQVLDLAGTGNQGSQQSFTLDLTPPTVLGVTINDQLTDPADLPSRAQPTSWTNQRSDLRTVRIQFSEPVAVSASDLVLTNLGVDAPAEADAVVALVDSQLSWDGTALSIAFQPYQLSDGVYQLDLLATISDLAGHQLDGDGDGSAGDPLHFVGDNNNRFYKLAADFNGDQGVSIFDFPTFAYWFGHTAPLIPDYVDLNDDQGASIFDFPVFVANFDRQIIFPGGLVGGLAGAVGLGDLGVLLPPIDEPSAVEGESNVRIQQAAARRQVSVLPPRARSAGRSEVRAERPPTNEDTADEFETLLEQLAADVQSR